MSKSKTRSEQWSATNVAACTCANLRKAARVMTQRYEAALHPTGLKATQFTVLATLAKGGALPLTQLADALVLDRTTLTRNLKPLVGRGLVAIENERDQRVRRVQLTAKGKKAFNDALPFWKEVQSNVVAGLGVKRWSGFLDDLAATIAQSRST